ncbi:amino acid ABC transporter permease [Enterobacter sp. Ap-1006]|uniref:amino acid ABC transporter permease n=1 Tax=Enterobacter sp. Ap-1006 TaxID=2608345 RepID=UPI00141E8F32|nr:amino acid ABC transporter permease [Enterobacter sp. Ap-1006]NIF47154.1 amino acid ABC transporter permease [Enterobacter sp. Ap-1006]
MASNLLSFYHDFLDQWPLIIRGIGATIGLTVAMSLTGFLLGIVVFYFSLSRRPKVARFVERYKSFFIGTPLICIIYILYYGLPQLAIRLTPFEVTLLGFTLNIAAYNAAYLLTAYNGMDKTQIEAAAAQGFSPAQIYLWIILPQVLRSSIPALTNQVIYNLKDSSLAFLVQYPELFARMQELAAGNFEFFKTYSLTALFYVVMATVIYMLSKRVEKRLQTA